MVFYWRKIAHMTFVEATAAVLTFAMGCAR